MTVNDYILELASKCDDLDFRDFGIHEYKQELYRAVRKIVKQYHITTRILHAEVKLTDGELTLELPGFTTEDRVFIDGNEYQPKDAIDEEHDHRVYYLKKIDGKAYFNFFPRSDANIVTIYYEVMPEAETLEDERRLDILPGLDTVYEESLLQSALFGLASTGLARFREEKLQKYQRILKLNSSRLDPSEVQKSEWARIKPFTLL